MPKQKQIKPTFINIIMSSDSSIGIDRGKRELISWYTSSHAIDTDASSTRFLPSFALLLPLNYIIRILYIHTVWWLLMLVS